MSSSQGYSDRLMPYENKGELGLHHEPDAPLAILYKAQYIARRIQEARKVVVHTGAGISTNAGIPDFRGPDGVWTVQQQQQQQQQVNREPKRRRVCSNSSDTKRSERRRQVCFEDAIPSVTHAVITALHRENLVDYVISQNVDGLHVKADLPREVLSELHGNLFVDWCGNCAKEFPRDSEATTVGLQRTGRCCPECDGALTDKALDWEDQLPEPDFHRAQLHSAEADLHVVVGTSCQMNPARNLPFRNAHGKCSRILVNLSETRFDDRFGTVVRGDCDTVFAVIASVLKLNVRDVTRVARLLFRFEYAKKGEDVGVDCNVYQMWDGEWSKRKVGGIRNMEYGGICMEDAEQTVWSGSSRTEAGYYGFMKSCNEIKVRMEIENVIYGQASQLSKVLVQFAVNRLPVSKEVTVTTNRLRCGEVIDGLTQTVRQKALTKALRSEDKGDVVSQYLVSSSNKGRGYLMCVLCNKKIWTNKGVKEGHVKACIQEMLTRND